MDKNSLHVKIVSPERTLFEGEVESITMPGALGEFEVLVNHAPLISSLSSGTVTCSGEETKQFSVSGGFVEVNHNELARLVLQLAVIYLVLGLCLFFGFTQGFGIAPVEIAQEVIIISVAFYSFTLVELAVTTQLSHKDSSYFIGANLGFSLLRLFLTLIILFIYKQHEEINFTAAFFVVMLYYFATLCFSTWHRRSLNQSTDNSNEKNSQT